MLGLERKRMKLMLGFEEVRMKVRGRKGYNKWYEKTVNMRRKKENKSKSEKKATFEGKEGIKDT